MNLCPTCKTSFSGGEQFCPRDGTPLRASLPEDPLAGRVLSGRYRLIEVIGRGGMGAVYRAHHILMDKPVAVKVLRQELASDTEAVARFHREARSASRLDHENIIRVSDFGQTDDGLLFLVMELLDGENLAQVLRRGALPWRRAAAIIRDMALGLGHAHEQGVIHRDLKPENIVLIRRGKTRQGVKVLDFGLAKLVQRAGASLSISGGGTGPDGAADGAEPDVAIQSLTRTGVVFGTPEYMSPEQAEGRSLDARTDIYALGVVSYQMLSGQLPFSAPTFLALIAKTVNEPPPPLRSASGAVLSLPPELEELVLRCLAKSPDERPQTADEIAEELAELLSRFPEEPGRSGEISVAAASGALAGGVARTVQRHLPPGQTPRTAPRDSSPPTSESGPRPEQRSESPLPQAGSPSSRPSPVPSASPPSGRLQTEPRKSGAQGAVSGRLVKKTQDAVLEPGHSARALVPAAPKQVAEVAEAPDSAEPPEPDAADPEAPLTVPRRPYWLAVMILLALVAPGVYFLQPRISQPGPPPPGEAEREPLRRARELLSALPPLPESAVSTQPIVAPPAFAAQIEEALRILREEREVHNTPEIHRLLSRAYEAQNNRLRALGHLYAAVRLSGQGLEAARSQLALSQLLFRYGHSGEACQALLKIQAGHAGISRGAAESELEHQAESLLNSFHCAPHN